MNFKDKADLEREIVNCKKCSRLVKFRVEVASRQNRFNGEKYWSRGVPGFGDINGKLMIVGLAPAATGANRTGRIFTGDKSSEFLVSCLYEAGITNQPDSTDAADGLDYRDSFITAVLKCVPPMDKPSRDELNNCSGYFHYEIKSMKNLSAILVLGRVAYDSVVRYFKGEGLDTSGLEFRNGSYNEIDGIRLYTSYHPSPRNVNTKRITREQFVEFLKELRSYLEGR